MPKTILIVDDEASFLNTLEIQLKEAGYEVITAQNGHEGLTKCRTYRPDVVILDIFMPGMQGSRVAEAISEDPTTSEIPIILTTSYLTRKEMPGDNLLGGRRFIAKPFKFDELHSLLKSALLES
ncbi:MAG: response regulator [Syntrophaceae bacterium]|nr:response regulator [Syntrophaceae bacterium]